MAKFLKQSLFICCFAFIFFAKIFAHDAGMSSINIEFSNQTLTISSEYSMREIEKIVPLDDQKALADLGLHSIILKVDGKIINASDSKYGFNDGHTFAFQQIFHGIQGEKVELQSLLISKLNPGHNQFLYVRRADEKTTVKEILTAENSSVTIDFEKLEPNNSFKRFLPLGVEHILFGYDHLLFLFALLLTVKSFGEIAKIVTSFTVAHSITLSLATLNIINVSPAIVEPLIALSIVFVGLENLFKREQNGRWVLTYVFGLIHGFGFASALQEIGIGAGVGVAIPLLSFNLGVEIGQIAVVLVLLPILWKLHKSSFYHSRFVPIGSVVVALAGIYWLIERTLF
ncbi:MAG TPA: HupE/UreJ family protein [Pyrinomonadaceae bacterium]|nr:HupE/UreJ family protein [Pyrinomonadaceae bacterium]